jgi:hypothetical protein
MGVRFVAANVGKLTEWRHVFHMHAETKIRDQPKLLSHTGHASVKILQLDIPLARRRESHSHSNYPEDHRRPLPRPPPAHIPPTLPSVRYTCGSGGVLGAPRGPLPKWRHAPLATRLACAHHQDNFARCGCPGMKLQL